MSSDPQHQLRPPFFFFCHERTGDALTRRRVPEKKVGRRFIRIQLSAPYFLRRIHNTTAHSNCLGAKSMENSLS